MVLGQDASVAKEERFGGDDHADDRTVHRQVRQGGMAIADELGGESSAALAPSVIRGDLHSTSTTARSVIQNQSTDFWPRVYSISPET